MEYVAVKEGGINWKFVSIPGGPKQATSLLSGHTPAGAAGGFHVPFVKDGTMRQLVGFDKTRLKVASDIPTLTELECDVGVSGASYAIFGPKGLPEPIQKKPVEVFRQATAEPAFLKVCDNFQVNPSYNGPKELAELIESDSQGMERLIKVTGITTEKGE